MKNTLKRTASMLLAIVMIVSVFVIGSTFTASATSSQEYAFGEEYHGTLYADNRQFKFNITKKSHVYIYVTTDRSLDISVYDSSGTIVSNHSQNTLCYSNDAGTEITEIHSCNLNAGVYYIGVSCGYLQREYTLIAYAEPVVSLSTPTITDISSPSGGKLKISYTGVNNALKYEIQYSKKDNFSSTKKGSTPAKSFTASGLSKGTRYYARVRAYTVYNDGLKVYSNWSRAQAVYVKKLNNKIEILTNSKSFKYNNLKKKNASLIIAATDNANAKFTYKLSSVPSKVKKYFSINKADGKLTVKKGLKKGTYKVEVTVSAAATGSYNKTSAKKTVSIKVS